MPYPLPPDVPPVIHTLPHQTVSVPELTEGVEIVTSPTSSPTVLVPEREDSLYVHSYVHSDRHHLTWVESQTLNSLVSSVPSSPQSDRLTWVETPTLTSLDSPDEETATSTEASALGAELSVNLHTHRSSREINPEINPETWESAIAPSHIQQALVPIAQTPLLSQTETEEPEETPIPIESAEPEAIPIPIIPPQPESVIELTADRQQFDDERQIFTAEGNVEMRFDEALLRSDKLQVNLINRLALATGNVSLVSGDQILLGSRFLYNFVQGTGTINDARGVVYIPTASSDFDFADGADPEFLPPGEQIILDQPPTDVTDAGGVIINVGGGSTTAPQAQQGGQVRRIRFEAQRLDFTPQGWEAFDVRFTNDPFSPPELEVRADRAQLTRISPLEDEVLATKPRLVFDQRLKVPLLRDRLIISKEERDPAIVRFGYDDRDRGGFFAERSFEVIQTRRVTLRLAPQLLIQRALSLSSNNTDSDSTLEEEQGEDSILSWIGLKAALNATLSPTTRLEANVSLAGLNNTGDTARANVQLRQIIAKHTLSAEYTYRNRLYNGSLGFQTVDRSVGLVFTSPIITLGDTGIIVNYQASFQNVYAPTDRLELLQELERGDRVSLNRTQASATVRRAFSLWKGEPLPSTPAEGLKYTPKPVVPYLRLLTGLTGTAGLYSNGDHQSYLQGLIGLQGQMGHFSRPWLDYTGFSLLYSQFIPTGESPFRFDRVADVRVLNMEINQQLYGPVRAAVRASFNLDTGKTISTDYLVEYSRRTYGLTFRYNPELGLAALGFRLGDFNWSGISESFSP